MVAWSVGWLKAILLLKQKTTQEKLKGHFRQ